MSAPAAKRACPPGALDTTVSNQSRASTLVGLGRGTTANSVTWDHAGGMHAQGYAAVLQNAEKRKRQQVPTACYTCRVDKARCSQTRPCQRCVRRGNTCSDDPDPQRSDASPVQSGWCQAMVGRGIKTSSDLLSSKSQEAGGASRLPRRLMSVSKAYCTFRSRGESPRAGCLRCRTYCSERAGRSIISRTRCCKFRSSHNGSNNKDPPLRVSQ